MNTPEVIMSNALWRILNESADPKKIAADALVRAGKAAPKDVKR